MTGVQQFRLPDVGEGLTEAEIVRWHVQPGDQVTVNQIIVEIETAKAVVELPCPWAGTVDALEPTFRAQEIAFAVLEIATNVDRALQAERRPWLRRLLGRGRRL